MPSDRPLWIGAGFGFGILNLPKMAFGVTALGQVRIGEFWPIDFGVAYFFDNDQELSDREIDLRINPLVIVPFPGEGSLTTFSSAELKVALCPFEQRMRTGSLFACAGVQGGLLFASPSGFIDEGDEMRGLFNVDLYARLRFRLADRIAVTYSAGVFIPVVRDRFGYVDGEGDFREQFRLPVVGGRLDAALVFGF